MTPRRSKAAMTAGAALVIVLSAALFLGRDRVYGIELDRSDTLEQRILGRIEGPPTEDFPEVLARPDGALRWELRTEPDPRESVGEAFFEEDELRAFTTARARGPGAVPDPAVQGPSAPTIVEARLDDRAVVLRWNPGSVNEILGTMLADRPESDLALAYRVYRAEGLRAARLVATVPYPVVTWRDSALPIARTTLSYEVWAVLLRTTPAGEEVLAGAERSEVLRVEVPERFELQLVDGTREEARFRITLGTPPDPSTTATIDAELGDALVLGSLTTRLKLVSLEERTVDRLTTRRRLVFASDGTLVLDPDSQQPRTTQTQVLIPVSQLVATLAHEEDGELRTLEADLD